LAKIVPNSATPMEPPIERKRIEPDVATPSCEPPTAFCTASTSTCIVIPSPRPTTSMSSDARAALVSASSWASRSIPTVTSAVPAMGNGR
jgi:hypothetical protein